MQQEFDFSEKKPEVPKEEIPKEEIKEEEEFTMDGNYLEGLNGVQRLAVETVKGPVMIIAGPGSGKTRVLTYRIAHLIRLGMNPYNILALTFTNKAAKEMKDRIRKIVGTLSANSIWMGTFHSIFARILRIEANELGYPSNFTIYDTDDAKTLIKNIVSEQNLNPDLYKANLVYNRISNAKSNLLTPQAYLKHQGIRNADAAAKRPQIGKLYHLYSERCQRAGAMDFDDLLFKMHELLNLAPEILQKYQNKFQYLMIDEFQDTNHAQYSIARKLVANHRNVCVVGDDAQSIYAFRGATIDNILNFEKDYPELTTLKLEQNYRSTKRIVDLANGIIQKNSHQIAKEIWTQNSEGGKIQLVHAVSDSEEAKIIADNIVVERLRYHYNNDEFAILYRTNAQSRVFEEALRRKGIPYRVYGGLSFYQRKEIKDLMAYLRLTVNHKDEEAMRRVINYPVRGIGKTSLKKIAAWANEEERTMWDIMCRIPQYKLATRTQNAIVKFVKMIKLFAQMLKQKDAYDLAKYIAKTCGLQNHLHNDKSVEGLTRYENLQELFNSIKEFTDNKRELAPNNVEVDMEVDASLGVYLQEVSLLTDADDNKDDSGKVKLMTVHAAKGLEFPCVYIVGLEEELFPSAMASKRSNDIEEERRLFYVAVTRAEKKLMLSHANCRYRFGKLQYCEPSRFIEEISKEELEEIGNKPRASFRPQRDSHDAFKDSISSNISSAKRQQEKQQQLRNRSNIPNIANFKASDNRKLKEGFRILHQRFGAGTVLKLEGIGDKRMAIIKFDTLGEKKMVLRFAKLMFKEDGT